MKLSNESMASYLARMKPIPCEIYTFCRRCARAMPPEKIKGECLDRKDCNQSRKKTKGWTKG